MDTETAALATPFKSKHAEKDRDQKNDESLKGRLFTTFLLGGPRLGRAAGVTLGIYLLETL
jgi:hypothetical protein